MSIALYMDQHVPRSITVGLRLRNVDVLTAAEDGSSLLSDPTLLSRANALGRILFSQDEDLLAEAHRRQQEDAPFAGLIYAHRLHTSIGKCISDLALIATVATPQELADQILFLPL